jgi:alkanesulfonate monooxygenase SsuD/methylene tetrahydromethanopterin reductase-like flavin-dependent oxidoreductase (luciferase family)
MLGAGAGWLRAEFDALDADFEARGAVTDEYLSVYQTLCRDERPQFDGEHYRVSDIVFAPKPVQRPWPPIHIGGNSTPAVRRAARLGDGWQPVSLPIEDVPHARARLDAQCEAAGRDPADVRLSLRCFYHVTGTPFDAQVRETLSPGQYLAEPAALAEQFRGFAEHGVEEVLFTPMLRHDSDLYVDQVERLIAAL